MADFPDSLHVNIQDAAGEISASVDETNRCGDEHETFLYCSSGVTFECDSLLPVCDVTWLSSYSLVFCLRLMGQIVCDSLSGAPISLVKPVPASSHTFYILRIRAAIGLKPLKEGKTSGTTAREEGVSCSLQRLCQSPKAGLLRFEAPQCQNSSELFFQTQKRSTGRAPTLEMPPVRSMAASNVQDSV